MTLRKVRMAAGLTLMVYLALHQLNHVFGLAGLALLERAREVFHLVWGEAPGLALLAVALSSHLFLSLYAVYRRRSFLELRRGEWAQLLLGVTIPPLLCIHILGVVAAREIYGTQADYTFLLLVYFHFSPVDFLQQAGVTLIAWAHGSIGLVQWLRLKPFYARWGGLLRGTLWLLPIIALAGLFAAGREVAIRAEDAAWLGQELARIKPPQGADLAAIYGAEWRAIVAYSTLLLLTLGARALRIWLERRRGQLRITYPQGQRVTVKRGTSILEASFLARVPHASVCGGRGRCSTCRVRVLQGGDHLPAASAEELKVLARVGGGADVRLACQCRPTGDVSVVPLLPASATPRDAWPRPAHLQGQEREIVVLFSDLRGFTALSQHRLPYDVVFILNRYFKAMGEAVEANGGHLDKFIGDGVMALFGLEGDSQSACRQALAAARGMGLALEELNATLRHDLQRPLKIGVGLHLGPAIVGEMGYGRTVSITAIGDTVNIASRLESASKELKVELVLSASVAARANLELPEAKSSEITLRGQDRPIAVLTMERLVLLPGSAQVPQEGLAAR